MTGPWGAPAPTPKRRTTSRLGLFLWLGAIGLCTGLAVALNKLFPGALSDGDTPYLVRTIGLIALVSSGLLFARNIKWRQTALHVGLWLAVGIVLLLGYAYQEELAGVGTRLRASLMPSYGVRTAANRMEVAAGENGGYGVYGTVNGAQVHFTIDTGASDVVLTPADARKAGIDLEALRYGKSYGTANGVGYGASVLLQELTIGNLRLTNVRASVNRTEIGDSLLGMTFLQRLKSFNFSNRKLVMTW